MLEVGGRELDSAFAILRYQSYASAWDLICGERHVRLRGIDEDAKDVREPAMQLRAAFCHHWCMLPTNAQNPVGRYYRFARAHQWYAGLGAFVGPSILVWIVGIGNRFCKTIRCLFLQDRCSYFRPGQFE